MEVEYLVRRVVKAAAAGLVHHTGVRQTLSAVRRAQAGGRRVLIIAYHRVVENFAAELPHCIPGLLTSKETFRRHLEDAQRAGYQFATLDEALDVISGRKTAKQDLCVVTFDDGYRDTYDHAYPILKEMGIPAMTYLPSDMIGSQGRMNHDRLYHAASFLLRTGRPIPYGSLPRCAPLLFEPVLQGDKTLSSSLDDFIGMVSTPAMADFVTVVERRVQEAGLGSPASGALMGWDEVRTMSNDGFDFGAHTSNHSVLTFETPDTIKEDLRQSKAKIEAELGKPIHHFAYCNGWYSDEVIRALVATGHKSAVTTEDTLNRIGGDPFTLKRKVVWENVSAGIWGEYSPTLMACQLDDVFGMLGVQQPVSGRRAT